MNEAKHLLFEALNERTATNPSYSLRAFARDLEISPQQLSNVLTGRRGLGPSTAQRIVRKLPLTEVEREMFLESLKANFSRSATQRSLAKGKLESLKVKSEVKHLQIDLFKIISNWHHFALVELIKIADKNQSSTWFSRKLGISEAEVKKALDRLENVGLISRQDNCWLVNQDVMIADQGIPSEAIRSYHRQFMEKATQALSFQNGQERYGSSSTIPIKVKDVEKAKKLIQDFRLAFDEQISDTKEGDEVYGLSIQFFRLTESDHREQT